MKLVLFSVLCFLAVACRRERELGPPKAVAVRQDGGLELRLMTFNIRYENNEDIASRSWRERVVGAVRMIREETPDVIGVQEARHGQAADLWASLPDYEFFGVGRDDGVREGEYSGIYYRRDRFAADTAHSSTFWLSDTPEKPGSKTWGNEIPRIATRLRLTDLASGRGFDVFNTHWDHRNQNSREHAALLLASRIDQRGFNDPVVLLGDFNALAANPAVAYLTGGSVRLAGREEKWESPLADVFHSLHPGEGNQTTLHFWSGSRNGSRKVDHILTSIGVKVLAADIRDQDDPMVSDHFPVTARVLFPGKSQINP